MHLLYIDGSGAVTHPDDDHFVLAGISVFERGIYHLIRAADDLVASWNLDPDPNVVEIHGSPMYQGRGLWRRQRRADRERMMREALALLPGHASIRIFGVVVHKAARAPENPVRYAFEEICNRFNLFLSRASNRSRVGTSEPQRGLVVMDESDYEKTLQRLAREFRVGGTRWGHLKNLAEVPLFVDSRASRIVQLADLVAYALWRRYEHQDGRFFDPITRVFDSEDGVIHGLFHYRARRANCYCPACMSRSHGQTGQRPSP